MYAKRSADLARGKPHGSVDLGLSVISAKRRRCRIDIDAEVFIYHIKVRPRKKKHFFFLFNRFHFLRRRWNREKSLQDGWRPWKSTVSSDSNSCTVVIRLKRWYPRQRFLPESGMTWAQLVFTYQPVLAMPKVWCRCLAKDRWCGAWNRLGPTCYLARVLLRWSNWTTISSLPKRD